MWLRLHMRLSASTATFPWAFLHLKCVVRSIPLNFQHDLYFDETSLKVGGANVSVAVFRTGTKGHFTEL